VAKHSHSVDTARQRELQQCRCTRAHVHMCTCAYLMAITCTAQTNIRCRRLEWLFLHESFVAWPAVVGRRSKFSHEVLGQISGHLLHVSVGAWSCRVFTAANKYLNRNGGSSALHSHEPCSAPSHPGQKGPACGHSSHKQKHL
jgi:hypothetical protein